MKRNKGMLSLGLLGMMLLAGCGESVTSSVTSGTEGSSSVVVFDSAKKIVPYTRDTTSGTREGFMQKIGLSNASKDDSSLKTTVQQVTSNGDMVQKLAADEYGIGYFSHDSISDAKALGVKTLTYEGIEATEKNILSGSYTLSRNFNYCFAQETDSVRKLIVSAFVAYMGTSEGLTTVKSNGGVVEIKTTTPSWNDIKNTYDGIGDDHSNVTINFGGSTSVEKIAKALSADFKTRAGNFQANHNHTGSGDAYKSTQGANKLSLDIAFASREFKVTDSEPLAEGTYGRVCVDGIVIGVQDQNPIENITGEQCLAIYSKEGTSEVWSDIK